MLRINENSIFRMKMRLMCLLFCGIYSVTGCKENPFFKDAGPLVKTNTGSIIGKYDKVFDRDVAAFLGIPYAKPPLGERRFAKPEHLAPWEGMLLANEKPTPCMQFSSRNFSWIPTTKPSEDCLYLNIWTPTKCGCGTLGKLPVLVWIHGGAFASGSTDMDVYDGGIIASYGEAIVVSINYRLGIFGFINGGTAEAPGNAGLHDQNLALRWIRENIEYFGGDASSITIFGESAGGMSVSLHMISPLSRNLFNRAILQSGSMYHPAMADTLEVAQFKANTIAKMVNCASDDASLIQDPNGVIQCLKKTDATVLAKMENEFTSKTAIYFLPSIGNEFLPKAPIEAFQSGDISQVDVMIGTVKDEGTFFLNYMMPELFPLDRDVNFTLEQAKEIIRGLILTAPPALADQIFAYYFSNVTEGSQEIVVAMANTFGDFYFNCPTLFLAEKINNAYLYWITHRSLRDPNPDWVGVHHFYEVPYVFGRPVIDSNKYTPEDGRFSGDLIQKWVSFARQGHPLSEERKECWPKFCATNPLAFELNPRSSKSIPFPRRQTCEEFWRPIFASTSPK